jgi:hypothetical protein
MPIDDDSFEDTETAQKYAEEGIKIMVGLHPEWTEADFLAWVTKIAKDTFPDLKD